MSYRAVSNSHSDMSSTQSESTKQSLVIVGSGMATGRLLDEIIQRSPDQYKITVIGEEPYGSYNRILLSSVLAKETNYKNIIQKTSQWYQDNHITFVPNMRVSSIDKENKKIYAHPALTSDTSTLEVTEPLECLYDKLVLAVGSRAAKIPAKNQNIEGIFSFRNILDTEQIESFAKNKQSAVVVGGGLLGLEAAYGLALSGIKVTLIHRNKWLLNRQLDNAAGDMLKKVMLDKNIHFVLGEEVVQFEHTTSTEQQKTLSGLTLTNGQYLAADIAVIATGITPNAELGKEAGLKVNRAIVVDDNMQTNDPSISALGECCEHNHETFGLVDPIWGQCESLAIHLTSLTSKPFVNVPVATKLKVSGVQLFSAGVVESSGDTKSYTVSDVKSGIYRKLIVQNECIVGIVLFGDTSSGMNYFDLMQNKTPVKQYLPELLLGYEYMESIMKQGAMLNTVEAKTA